MPKDEMSGALAVVQSGEALYRIEHDAMLRVAVERPRNEDHVLAGALAELERYPEEAAQSGYAIPYRNADGSTTTVEGPSISAALALARRWTNCAAKVAIVSQDQAGVNLTGMFVDYESTFRLEKPFWVSRFFKRRNGSIERLEGQRFEAIVQAGSSKVLRNVILSGLPKGLVATYYKRTKEIIAGGKLDAGATLGQVAKSIDAFARWQVTAEQLEKFVDLPRQRWTGEVIARLRGTYQAIVDEQTTVAEVFGGGAPVEGEGTPDAQPASTLDQATAKLRATPDGPTLPGV